MKRNHKLIERIIIRAPQPVVFDFTQDYSKRLTWDTFLKKAELMRGAVTAGEGVYAYCVTRTGFGMETRYVTFRRPKVTAIKMTKGTILFKTFAGSWAFDELDPSQTEVTFTYSFSLPFLLIPFGSLVKWVLRSNIRQRLIDLKACVEPRRNG